MEAKWITFEKINPPLGSPIPKTVTFYVQTKSAIPEVIGEIKWYGCWRKYCFFPEYDTVYEQDCLRDIAAFCEEKTAEHRQNRAELKQPPRGQEG